MVKQKSLLSVALLASITLSVVSCNKGDRMMADNQGKKTKDVKRAIATNGVTTGVSVLPQSGWGDGYYVVSKLSNRIVTIVPEGNQLAQTELLSTSPSASADLTISNFGTVTNPSGFKPGTYPIYSIQFGSIAPYSLVNRVWDVQYGGIADGTPIIGWGGNNQANQRFVFEPTGDSDGSVYIRSLYSGNYLQIAGNSFVNTTSGALVELWHFNGSLNQKFFINLRTQ